MKMRVTVAGFCTEGDRQGIERKLNEHIKPILGELDIQWVSRTANGRPSFAAHELQPGQAELLAPAIREVFGAICTFNLKEKAASAA